MHLSVDSNSRFYHPAVFRVTVTLNGKLLSNCVEANEEAGTVVVYTGQIDEYDNQLKETKRGLVRIAVPREHSVYPGYPAIPDKNIVGPKPALPGLMRVR